MPKLTFGPMKSQKFSRSVEINALVWLPLENLHSIKPASCWADRVLWIAVCTTWKQKSISGFVAEEFFQLGRQWEFVYLVLANVLEYGIPAGVL